MDTSHLVADALTVTDDPPFRLLAENMSDLICLHALDGTYQYVSPSSERLLGYTPAELVGTSPYALFHPDDISHIEQGAHQQSLRGVAKTYVVYRIRTKSGEYIWLETLTQPIMDAQGNMIQLQTASRDVTERVLAEKTQRASEERLRLALRIARLRNWEWNLQTDEILYLDDQGPVPWLPPGRHRPTFEAFLAAMHPDDRSRVAEAVRRTIEEGADYEVEFRLLRDGIIRWVVNTGQVYRDEAGRPFQMIGMAQDITHRKHTEEKIREYNALLEQRTAELEQANAQLSELATLDGLTGLKNHRAFQERLAEECRRATRHMTALSLVLMDVDWFKAYNDAFGHPAGDIVLCAAGKILRETVRETDFVARYGGEEFAVILPQTDREAAWIMAERLRAAIEDAEWEKRQITASFGVSCLSAKRTAPDALIASADEALYQSKANGRNRVTFRPEEAP